MASSYKSKLNKLMISDNTIKSSNDFVGIGEGKGNFTFESYKKNAKEAKRQKSILDSLSSSIIYRTQNNSIHYDDAPSRVNSTYSEIQIKDVTKSRNQILKSKIQKMINDTKTEGDNKNKRGYQRIKKQIDKFTKTLKQDYHPTKNKPMITFTQNSNDNYYKKISPITKTITLVTKTNEKRSSSMSKMLNSLHKENVYEKFKNNLVKKANIDLFETNRINKEIDNYSKEFQKDFFTEKYNKINSTLKHKLMGSVLSTSSSSSNFKPKLKLFLDSI